MAEGKTPRRPGSRGPDRLDAVLVQWPAAERDALEWDESAERVLAAVASGESRTTAVARATFAVSDEDLLRAPLPQSPNEVQSSAVTETRSEGSSMSTASRERERDRASFRDLAKLANTAPPSSGLISSAPPSSAAASGEQKKEREENSGVINLAELTASEEARPAAAVAATAPVPEIMSTLRSVGAPAKDGPPSSVPASAEKAAGAAAAPKASKRSVWVPVGGVVAAAAVAAGVFFGMSHGPRGELQGPVAIATTAAPVGPKGAAAGAGAAPRPGTTVAPEERGVDPMSLPPANAAMSASPAPSLAARTTSGGAATGAASPGKPAAAPTDSALVAVIPPTPAPSPAAPSASANLQALMQQAAGVTSSPSAPATTSPDAPATPAPGSVPLKPSQGAIQGALGAALPSARGCLGPDDPISHATITFASDGSVASVGVSGGAAGKPAEGCIRTALSKARVAPFAQPTFTATATVRPN